MERCEVAEEAAGERGDIAAEVGEHGGEGAELDNHGERVVLQVMLGAAEKLLNQQQVGGAADRQKLGQPLYHAEKYGLPDRHWATPQVYWSSCQ